MANIKVKYSKLGRKRLWGQAHFETNTIEIDIRTKGLKLIEILLHESHHLLQPNLSEKEVTKVAKAQALLLWKQNIKPIDNDTTQPLQP